MPRKLRLDDLPLGRYGFWWGVWFGWFASAGLRLLSLPSLLIIGGHALVGTGLASLMRLGLARVARKLALRFPRFDMSWLVELVLPLFFGEALNGMLFGSQHLGAHSVRPPGASHLGYLRPSMLLVHQIPVFLLYVAVYNRSKALAAQD